MCDERADASSDRYAEDRWQASNVFEELQIKWIFNLYALSIALPWETGPRVCVRVNSVTQAW